MGCTTSKESRTSDETASSRVAPSDDGGSDGHADIKRRYTRHTQLVRPGAGGGGGGASMTMSKDEVRALWPDADRELFDSAYKIFDWTTHSEEEKADNVKMFTILMVSLLAPHEERTSPTHLYEIAFLIFDVDESGSLDKDEFAKMIGVIYKSKANALRLVFQSAAGHDMLNAFAEREHCAENIDFLDAVGAWGRTAAEAGAGDVAEARHIRDTFCTDIAPTPVNLSHKTMKALTAAMAADAYPPDLFELAKKDILRLVEQDTFARFNKDKERLGKLVDDLFLEVDKSRTGKIEKGEYVEWARGNPEVTKFYQPLSKLTHDVQHRKLFRLNSSAPSSPKKGVAARPLSPDFKAAPGQEAPAESAAIAR